MEPHKLFLGYSIEFDLQWYIGSDQLCTLFLIPSLSNLRRRISWDTVSNAFLKSTKDAIVQLPWFTCEAMSSVKPAMVSIVLLCFLKPS